MPDERIIGPSPSTTEECITFPGVDESRNKFNTYSYNGIMVPRVSEILSACFNKEQLIRWAASISLDEYNTIKKDSTTIGTFAHEQMENYMDGKETSVLHINKTEYRDAVSTCILNLEQFVFYMDKLGVLITPLFTEHEITTPWYGGTIDCIASIEFQNNYMSTKNIIIDYKTSKSISPEYIMQTFAYLWAVNWLRTQGCNLPEVRGIMIIRVDKIKICSYDYIYLDFELDPVTYCCLEHDLANMINWFYSQINVNYLLKQYKKANIIEEAYNEHFGIV